MQRLGQQRVGVEDLADPRVGAAGRDGLAQRADGAGMRGHELRYHDGRRRARRAPGRGVGQDRPDPGRVAASAVIDSRRPDVKFRVVDAEHGGDLRGGTGQAVVVGVRHRQHQCGGALGQAGGDRTPVASARCDEAGLRLAGRGATRQAGKGAGSGLAASELLGIRRPVPIRGPVPGQPRVRQPRTRQSRVRSCCFRASRGLGGTRRLLRRSRSPDRSGTLRPSVAVGCRNVRAWPSGGQARGGTANVCHTCEA